MIPLVHCKTADDVRALAVRQSDWRRRLFRPEPPPAPVAAPVAAPTLSPPPVIALPKPPTPPKPEPVAAVIPPPVPSGLMRRPSIADVIRAAAAHFHETPAILTSKMRFHSIVRQRNILMFVAREVTGQTLVDIGLKINREHTTVLGSIRKIQDLVYARETQTMEDITAIMARLGLPWPADDLEFFDPPEKEAGDRPPKDKKGFSDEDIVVITRAFRDPSERRSLDEIAAQLGRTERSIRRKAYKLGLGNSE